jgi:hypothetical protein
MGSTVAIALLVILGSSGVEHHAPGVAEGVSGSGEQGGVDALLHDIGRMVFQRLANPLADAGFRFARQVRQGCFRIPDLVVDRSLS